MISPNRHIPSHSVTFRNPEHAPEARHTLDTSRSQHRGGLSGRGHRKEDLVPLDE